MLGTILLSQKLRNGYSVDLESGKEAFVATTSQTCIFDAEVAAAEESLAR